MDKIKIDGTETLKRDIRIEVDFHDIFTALCRTFDVPTHWSADGSFMSGDSMDIIGEGSKREEAWNYIQKLFNLYIEMENEK